jgi:hypothetical protein
MSLKSYFLPPVPKEWENYKDDFKGDNWTLSNERAFMEDLVYKRLTLFLAIMGALIAAAINLRELPGLALLLLALGTLLLWMMQQAIERAQRKLDIILTLLFSSSKHPTGYINTILKDEGRVGLVGHIVPKAVCILLTLAVAVEFCLLIA